MPTLFPRPRQTNPVLGLSRPALLAAILVTAALVSGAPRTDAATFTVNVTTDDPDASPGNGTCAAAGGVCSLRAAIMESNVLAAGAPHTINFNIPGGGVQTIQVGTGILGAVGLPTIQRGVTINGYTQPGSSVNTGATTFATNAVITVEINGTAAPATNGLVVNQLGAPPASLAQGTTIRGLCINRFGGFGIQLITGFNTVAGNFLGTNPASTSALPNNYGIDVTTNVGVGGNNRIGISADPTSTNLISGNTFDGIAISGSSTLNTVRNNLIGTDAAGTASIANKENGIWILGGANNNTIGGTRTAPAEGNLISGNGTFDVNGVGINGNGILISSSGVDSNIVRGNLIGVDRTTNVALPNAEDGVQIAGGAKNNRIGGTAANTGNVISGNLGNGIQITGGGTTGNIVEGNGIGTNAAITGAVPNKCDGILLTADSNTIGGMALTARNVIGGSMPDSQSNCPISTLGHGIQIRAGANNQILNNSIGWDAVGGIISNLGAGIRINASAAIGNRIGDGTSQGANSIYRNNGLGISLGDGVNPTANDPDPGSGPNNFQNYPVITSAINGGGVTTIAGTFNSIALTQYRIQFFSSALPNGSGFYQGEQYEGSTLVTTDGVGNANINFAIGPPVIPLSRRITATATNVATGDTSEFSVATNTTPVELMSFEVE